VVDAQAHRGLEGQRLVAAVDAAAVGGGERPDGGGAAGAGRHRVGEQVAPAGGAEGGVLGAARLVAEEAAGRVEQLGGAVQQGAEGGHRRRTGFSPVSGLKSNRRDACSTTLCYLAWKQVGSMARHSMASLRASSTFPAAQASWYCRSCPASL